MCLQVQLSKLERFIGSRCASQVPHFSYIYLVINKKKMCLQYRVAQHGFSAGVPSVFTEKLVFFFCSHGAWVSRCKTACRILNVTWCRTPLSIFDFSSVVICCCSPLCSITGENQKVKHCLRLMSTSRSVSKCRWWQMAFLIECVLFSVNSSLSNKLPLDSVPSGDSQNPHFLTAEFTHS